MKNRFTLLLNFALQFRWRVLLSILLGFSGALFNGINTTLLVPILLQFLDQEIELTQAPKILERLLSPFEKIPAEYRLTALMAVVLLSILLKSATGYCNTLVNVSLRRGLMNRIREAGFKILLYVDIDFYNKSQLGDLSRKLNGESSKATHAITSLVRSVNVIATVLTFLAILIALSWQLTLISSILIASLALVSQLYVRRAKVLGQRLAQQNKAYSVHLYEVLSGIRLIRTFVSEDREYKKLLNLIHTHAKTEFQSQMVGAVVGPLNEIISIIILIFIVFLGRLFFSESLGSLSTILLIYLIILFRLLPFVGQLNSIRTTLANAAASVEIVYDFLREDNKPFMFKGQLPYEGLKHEIKFTSLDFAYPGHEQLALNDICLTLPRGQTLALVGSSGSGKSTLASLLARFYDPTEGTITLDGTDLCQFDLTTLRRRMGIVSQETFLFNDSVWNNIAYARPDATEEEVVNATKQANAYDFIQGLPQGWDTKIGDRGVVLSGGQRQRLAIARALLQDPDILILDEATSALDTISERLVQQALDDLSRDRTTLVVAHRLSTICQADKIAVLSQGKVIEIGSHDELLEQESEYCKLWQMQFGPSDSQRTNVTDASKPNADRLEHSDKSLLVRHSYQMRTDLNSVLGTLKLLADGIEDDPLEQQELAEDAYRSAMNLLRLIEVVEYTT
jgi:subfamily B ATP-binding cassette protein MsbA